MSPSNPEPLLTLLPPPAQSTITALQRQYELLPLEAVTGAVLATMAAAVGPSVLATRVAEPLAASFRIVIAVGDDSLLPEVIGQIVAPLRSYQARSVANSQFIDGSALVAELAERRRRYLEWTLNERFPDPVHGQGYQQRIMEARRLLPKLVLTDTPVPGATVQALQHSPDEQAFLVSLDPARTATLIAHWLSERGAGELALLEAAQSGHPYLGPAGNVARPLVNALFLATPATLRAMVAAGDRFPCFWLMDATQANIRLRRSRDDVAASRWEHFMHGLLDQRFASAGGTIPVTGEVFQYFADGLNALVELDELPPTRRRTERNAITSIASLASILHMAGEDASRPLTLATASRAVSLSLMLRANLYAVREARAETPFMRFLRDTVVDAPGDWLTLKDLKAGWAGYAKTVSDGAEVAFPTRDEIADAVLKVCGVRVRNDVHVGDGLTRGWKNLALRPHADPAGSVQNLPETKVTLRIS